MTSNLNDPFDPLYLYMSDFIHLLSSNPNARLKDPPPLSVKEAQNRAVYDFFISYRHDMSKTYAQMLADELKEFGYQVYFAGEILGLEDEQLRAQLRKELRKSRILAIVGNKNMMKGEWVKWEMDTFFEDHDGRITPVITEDMGSPITNDSWVDYDLKTLRAVYFSAATIYEENEEAWKNQKPSSMTIFCLLLVREFYRVELEFWHKWSPMSDDERFRLYLESMYEDTVCRIIMTAMKWPHKDYSLAQLKSHYLKEAREN
jgi:hypothetical protein